MSLISKISSFISNLKKNDSAEDKDLKCNKRCYIFDELNENPEVLKEFYSVSSKTRVSANCKDGDLLNVGSINSETYPNLAKSINNYLEHGTNKNSIIGLTGQWGSGKTSFCKFLEFELCHGEVLKNNSKEHNNSNYIFFFFDLWMHQKDNLRKSLLTELTSFLLEKSKEEKYVNLLKKENVSDPAFSDLLSWLKLKHVGTRRNYSVTSVTKFLTCAFGVFFLFQLVQFIFNLIGIFNSCSYSSSGINIYPPFLLLIEFSIILFVCFIFVVLYNGFPLSKSLNKIFSGLHTVKSFKYAEDSCNNDLSSNDFQYWIKSIYNDLKNGTNLVLVLDNLDRLPSDLIKDLFSTIHDVFFSLNDKKILSDNKRIHILIPFEYVSLCSTFLYNENNINEKAPREEENKQENLDSTESTDKKDNLIERLDAEFQFDSVDLSEFRHVEDILDKTFSVIFYVPHFNPYSYRELFDKKLSLIINNWLERTEKFVSIDLNNSLYHDVLQKVNEFRNNLNNKKQDAIKNCWFIFADGEDDRKLSIRSLLSYLREITLILSINYKNFCVDNKIDFYRVLLYVAFYSKCAPLFRKYSFPKALDKIGNSWTNPKYGIVFIDDWGKVSSSTQKSKLYGYFESIYYQMPINKASGGVIFFKNLVSAIEEGGLDLIEYKLNNRFFYNHSREVIDTLLEQVKSFDLVIDFLKKINEGSIDIFKYTELTKIDQIQILQDVWKGVYFSIIQYMTKSALSGILQSNGYDFLKQIYLKYFSSNKVALFLLVTYLKFNICNLLYFNSTDESVGSVVTCLKEFYCLDKEISSYGLTVCDECFNNMVNNHDIDLVLFEKTIQRAKTVVLNCQRNSDSTLIQFPHLQEAVLSFFDYSTINGVVRTILGDQSIFEHFESLQYSVIFEYAYNKDSVVPVSVNWTVPVSFKSREFILKHIRYASYDDINLRNELFILLQTSLPKDLFIHPSARSKYLINRYIYKFALLLFLYEHKNDDDFSLVQLCELYGFKNKETIPHNIEKLLGYIQFLLLYFPLSSLAIKGKDAAEIDKLSKDINETTRYDDVKEARLEFYSCFYSLLMVKDFIFNHLGNEIEAPSHDYSDKSIQFFIKAFLSNNERLIQECFEYLDKTPK